MVVLVCVVDVVAVRRLACAPDGGALRGNAVSEVIAYPGRGQWLAVLATGLSVAGSGAVFALLRLRSRSVLAPVLAHAAVNIRSYVAVRRATKADGLAHGGR